MTYHDTDFPPLMETPSPPSTFWPPPPLNEPSQPLNYMSPLQFNFITPPPPPPSFPDEPESIDLSPLGFVLALVAVVTIPALLYTFFFSIKFPTNPFRRRSGYSDDGEEDPGGAIDHPDVVSGVEHQKDNHVKDIGSECPVCLSVFADGEDIKQLSACKHSFHASCIDMWLNSHNNCPICRASVPVKRPDDSNNRVVNSTRRDSNNDLHQGMPDAANLV